MRASARKGLLFPAAAGLLAAAAIGASTGSAAESSPLEVEVLSTSQSSILATGKLRARVQADVAGVVKLAPQAQLAAGSPATRIGRARRVTFDEPGSKLLRLRLSAAGRRLIGDCRPKSLVVSARMKTSGAHAAAIGRALVAVPLAVDGPACISTPAPAAPTGPGGPSGVDSPDPGEDPDDAPVAVDDAATVDEDSGATSIDVLANDTDADGGPMTIQSASDPANGAVVITGGGTGLTYQPDPDYCNDGSPTDDFTYTLNGGSEATVSVTVTCDDGEVPPPTPWDRDPIDTANADRCDFLDPAVCLQPFPNDYFTVADPTTNTGRRLNLDLLSMPRNRAGKPIEPTEQNLNDGFSPGNSIIVRIPGLDNLAAFQQTGAVGIDDIDAYDDPDQPVVVINAETGERHPIWSEIDYNPLDPAKGHDPQSAPDRANVNLIIRPAVNLEEGERYIVALRDLKNEAGDPIEATPAFEVYRDNRVNTGGPGTPQPEVESRRARMEQLFQELGAAGIQRSNLYLTWDFTVASERNLTERALSIRDDAFEQLGDTDLDNLTVEGDAPQLLVTSSTDYPPCDADGDPACARDPITDEPTEDNQIARVVQGQIAVPCYLNAPGCPPGSRFFFPPGSSVPQAIPGNTTNANFQCEIPRSTLDPASVNPARPSLYGHGLLGSAGEVDAGNIKAMANEHNFIFCATDWAGFATTDAGSVLASLQDLSHFPSLVDRMQQGFVNQMYLGRAMIHPDGFSSDAAFQDGGESAIDTDRLFYDGNSQGGIMGGALTALSPDFERAVLGVPAMNYSTLLNRSVDFEPYAEGNFTQDFCGDAGPFEDVCNQAPHDTPLGLYDNYPNQLERPLIYALMQLLWDRGEANGYAHHMTDDPLPNTPAHDVLLHVAFGDHQVANVAAEVEARTIGASVYQPALEPDRYWAPNGIFDIPGITQFPFAGSALVYWDGGPLGAPGNTATPPNENIPPRPPEYGSDPHSYPRSDVKARAQKSDFLAIGGSVRNYCTTANSPDPPFSLLVPETGTPIPCHSRGWTGP